MENQRCDGGGQASLSFKCKKIIPDGEKYTSSPPRSTKMESKKALEDTNVGTPTPPQIIQPSRVKQKGASVPLRAAKQISKFFQVADVDRNSDSESSELRKIVKIDEAKLPEKYVAIADLFNRMDTSIRLLNLQKKMPTFSNISLQLEVLSKRKFTYQHLAQMKYVFPEAVAVEKILVHDKHTLCMKPDLKISLVHVVELGSDESLSVALCQAFRLRLLDFLKLHDEEYDIPEALLPEPFNHPKCTISCEVTPQLALPEKVNSNPNSFSISKDVNNSGADLQDSYSQRDDCLSECPLPIGASSPGLSEGLSESDSFVNMSHLPPDFREHFAKKTLARREKAPTLSSSQLMESGGAIDTQDRKFKEFSSDSAVVSSPNRIFYSSPCYPTSTELVLTPVVETPNIQVSKRPVLTPNDCPNTVNSTSYHSSTKRLLDFSAPLDVPTGDEVYFSDENRAEKASDNVKTLECSEEDPMMIQTGTGKKSQMPLPCLLDLVNVVQLIFQKAKFSFITKQELVHKIIWHSSEITDKREVEEQVELLEELVPDWLHRKMASSGDCFYCIKKTSDPVSVRQKIVESF